MTPILTPEDVAPRPLIALVRALSRLWDQEEACPDFSAEWFAIMNGIVKVQARIKVWW